MRLSALLLSLLSFHCFEKTTASSNFPLIHTSFGSLRGFAFISRYGTEAEIFKKVPFAQPPIGELRWRKPQAPKPWNTTLDNTSFGPACAQRTTNESISGVSEDCLYINVYTSRRCRESNATCAVVFIVHGGSGVNGSPTNFDDETLVRNFVSQDILVVTTAYRLAAFGAMSLGDEKELPSNLAMHDVIAALNFTRSEIGKFGGDKERITLLGQSHGGNVVLMTAFSPGISKPGGTRLMNGVISMSGNSGLVTPEQTVKRSLAVAKELGCEGTAREIIDCLRPFDTESILAANFKVHGPDAINGEGPKGITQAGELFPIASEREMRLRKDPVRIMTGSTIYEVPGEPTGEDRVNRILGVVNKEECLAKYRRDLESGDFDSPYVEVSQEIIVTSNVYSKYIAEIGGEAYLYEYDNPVHGKHTEDAYFIFGSHAYEKDENEEWLSRVYPHYFARFIKGERPAEDWSPVFPHLMNYYSINRSRSDNVYPHMKYEYQKNLIKYYDGIAKYDYALSIIKNNVQNASVHYKVLNFDGDAQDFLESLTITDAIILFCIVVGAFSILCCLCNCFTQICCWFCCCCRSKRGCEHEPLLVHR